MAGEGEGADRTGAMSADSGAVVHGKEISDLRLGDLVLLLDQFPQLLRAMSLSVRSMYTTRSTKMVSVPAVFETLQQAFAQEAAVLRHVLVPLTIQVILQMQCLVDHYTMGAFAVWDRRINDTAASVKEYQVLSRCLAEFYEHLHRDAGKLPPLVRAVREALQTESMKFSQQAGVLSIKCLVKDPAFVPLLFVPEVDYYAAPMVHGGETNDFRKPAVAKDIHERAFTSAMTLTNTLIPAVDKASRIFRELDNFFTDMLAELQELGAVPTPLEDPLVAARKARKPTPWEKMAKGKEEEQKEEEVDPGPPPLSPAAQAARQAKRQRHFDIVKPKAAWMERSIRQLPPVVGNITTDLECTLEPEPSNYAEEWLEQTTKTATGEDIVDVARAATLNVEIKAALDPFE